MNFLNVFQDYIKEMVRISGIANKAQVMLKEQKKLGVTQYSFPEILSANEHLVSFDEMYPMHLIGHRKLNGKKVKGKDLVPVEHLAPLNGQMICLTGQNAGGKTSLKVELVNQLFLAQSGFPVFAKNLCFNPKKIIGLVFVERGKGSLVQLLLTKTKNILEVLEHHEGNQVVVIIDELLTGTQEASALEIGRRTLKKFNSAHCSTIFSTQITALAQYAGDELNALNFCFNERHQISEGISMGNPELLIRQIGMEKYLNV